MMKNNVTTGSIYSHAIFYFQKYTMQLSTLPTILAWMCRCATHILGLIYNLRWMIIIISKDHLDTTRWKGTFKCHQRGLWQLKEKQGITVTLGAASNGIFCVRFVPSLGAILRCTGLSADQRHRTVFF
jgi:hypothetical protein